jgi:hypothetical protein
MKKLIIFLVVANCFSAYSQIAKYSNEFLAIGVGAHALGMSNSRIASVNDVTSGYFNPAGLANLSQGIKTQGALMHSEYFAGIAKYDYFGLARRIDSSSVVSLNVIRLGVDDIPNTLDLIDANGQIDYDRVKRFSAADYAFLMSYARKSKIEGLTFGGTAKIIRRTVGSFANAWGFGIDAGIQYKKNGFSYGATLRDAFGTFNAWSMSFTEKETEVLLLTNNVVPKNSLEVTVPRLILGSAKNFEYKKFTALAEVNLETTFDGYRNTLIKSKNLSIDPRVGLEFGYANTVFLRGGIGNIQEIKTGVSSRAKIVQPNLGLGLKIKMIHLDYAFSNVGQQVGLLSHVFSLKVDLKK